MFSLVILAALVFEISYEKSRYRQTEVNTITHAINVGY